MSGILDMEVEDEFEFVNLPEAELPPPKKKSRSMTASPPPSPIPLGPAPAARVQNEEVKINENKNHFEDWSIPNCVLQGFTEEQLARIFPVLKDAELAASSVENPFVSKMKNFAAKSMTVNGSPTFNTSGDARLDFFFKVMEKTPTNKAVELFRTSWEQNPLDTFKLLAYLRNCRGGKGVRTPFQACLFWLYETHPKTLEVNLKKLPSFGYWKDLLHFLMTICFGGVVPHYLELDDSHSLKKSKKVATSKVEFKLDTLKARFQHNQLNVQDFQGLTHIPIVKGRRSRLTRKKVKSTLLINRWDLRQNGTYNKLVLEETQNRDPTFHPKVKRAEFLSRRQRREMLQRFAQDRSENDEKYRYFHVKIAQLFAEQLKLDRANMIAGKGRLSLSPKWSPSLKGHFDKFTLIGTTVALELMNLENFEVEMDKPCETVRAFLYRRRYHKEYLVKMRKYLKIPETFMCADKWSQLDYNRVPALCMRQFTPLFLKHDKKRFESFVGTKTKVAGSTLKPVEIITELMGLCEDQKVQIEVLEKQWASMVDSIRGRGRSKILNNALAICDVSGSMEGEPMAAAIGLSILIMELNSKPWNESCLTFHENPSVFQLSSRLGLYEKVQKMLSMDCGLNTDLNKVFDLILYWAIELKNEIGSTSLPSTILIFTDMEFDEAFPGTKQTNFEVIKEKFDDAGFEMPRTVFWNLRGGCAYCTAADISPENFQFCKGILSSVPVKRYERDTILLSGYSGQQLKLIMQNQNVDDLEPLGMLLKAIGHKQYNEVQIID